MRILIAVVLLAVAACGGESVNEERGTLFDAGDTHVADAGMPEMPDAGTPTAPDAGAADAGGLCALCTENADCNSGGWCISGPIRNGCGAACAGCPDGEQCTCPADYVCRQVMGMFAVDGGLPVSMQCVPAHNGCD